MGRPIRGKARSCKLIPPVRSTIRTDRAHLSSPTAAACQIDMGAIATEGSTRSLKLFRDDLRAASAIPGIFLPVETGVEGNGKR
jgi:hypothetical protein